MPAHHTGIVWQFLNLPFFCIYTFCSEFDMSRISNEDYLKWLRDTLQSNLAIVDAKIEELEEKLLR